MIVLIFTQKVKKDSKQLPVELKQIIVGVHYLVISVITLYFANNPSLSSFQPTPHHHEYMATVKKISRSISYLPPIKTLADWFSYAFKSSELDEVHRFPTLSPSTGKSKI